MQINVNWRNIAALLSGIAAVVASLSGYVPADYADLTAGIGSGLLVLAGLFRDDDGDGVPNIVDAPSD